LEDEISKLEDSK